MSMRDLSIQRPTISTGTNERYRPRTFRNETQYAKLGSVANVDDRVDENLEESVEHLRLFGALLRRADVVVRGEDIFLEDLGDGSTGLKHDTVEVIKIGVVIAMTSVRGKGGYRTLVRTGRSQGNP